MIPLWLTLSLVQAQDVCALGCPHATVQSAVDSVAPGGTGLFFLGGGVHDGEVVIEGNRRIFLTTLAPEPVVLTGPAGAPAILTVRGAATLDLVAISIDADGVRGFDVSEGATVNASLGVAFGGGIVGDGAIARVRDATFRGTVYGFLDGYSAADGGLLHVVDSDLSLDACSLGSSSALDGGAIYARATGTRRTVAITNTTFADVGAVGSGGALALRGDLDVTLSGLLIEDARATQGGAIAVIGDGMVVDMVTVLISVSEAYAMGGSLYQSGGTVTVVTSAFSDGAALDGGGVALLDGDLTLSESGLLDNLALGRGGGAFVSGGRLTLRDVDMAYNLANIGGGLWIGGDAGTPEIVRTTVCRNGAGTHGGGAWLGTTADIDWHNVRLLDNLANTDGGGIYHTGPGSLTLRSANVLGSTSGSGGGSAIATAAEATLRDVLVAYSTGGIAIRRTSATPVALLGGTAWWQNEQGDALDLTPSTPGAQHGDPKLTGYTPGEDCATMQDWGGWYGPLRDAGSEGLLDPDGTRIDIGAFGGPDADPALWTIDADGDGAPVLYDCDELDPNVYPLAQEVPYDGLDANCDRLDDFDADQDGHRPPEHGGEDCDDLRADVFPGAEEVASEPPVDQNCDGRFDADGDGFEPPDDCDDDDPEAHPGAVDGDPSRDLDCNGFVDDPRVIRPVSCASAASAPDAWLAALAGLLLSARLRSGSRSAPPGRRAPNPSHRAASPR